MERIIRVSVLLWAAVLLFTGCGIGNDTNNMLREGKPQIIIKEHLLTRLLFR